MKKDRNVKLECDCGSEILNVEYLPAIKKFEIAIFKKNVNNNFIVRMYMAFQCLFGSPYADQIVIDEKKARKLAKFLSRKKKQ